VTLSIVALGQLSNKRILYCIDKADGRKTVMTDIYGEKTTLKQ